MNKIYTRKIILAAAVFVLAVIYIIQSLVSSRPSEKIFKIQKSFDSIEISSLDNGNLKISRSGDSWKIDENDADETRAERLSDAAKEIKTLGIVAKSSDESADERYGLTDSQKISVKISGSGEELLSLEIGKDAAGGQQNYIRINGGKEIYLASGALKSTFNVKKESLVKKTENSSSEEKK